MNTQKVLGIIVAGYIAVTAAAIITHSDNKTEQKSPTASNVKMVPIKPFPVALENKIDTKQFNCLATNIYWEGRNQRTISAMAGVAYTVLNRVAAKHYPNTICKVVYQGNKTSKGAYIRNKCQFSWVCDSRSDTPSDRNILEVRAWERAKVVAMGVLHGTIPNPVGNATMYHASYCSPYWKSSYKLVATVGDHLYYETKKRA